MKKHHWIVIISALILLTACSIPNNNSNHGDIPLDSPQPYVFGMILEDQLYYPIVNGQQAGAPFRYDQKDTTEDRSVTIVRTSDDELLMFTKNGRQTIATEVSRFLLDDGKKQVIYYSGQTLYSYNLTTGSSITLIENVSRYIFSADRETIAYVNDSNEVILRTGNAQKVFTVLDQKAGLAGVSNDGKHIYITVEKYPTCTLYHYDSNGTITELLQYDSSNVIDFCFFADKAQFFVSTFNESYVSIDGQPAEKLTDYWVAPVPVVYGGNDNMEDLRNWAYWTAKGEILYITDDPTNPITLVQGANTALCDPSGRYIWYAKDNNMMRLDTHDGVDAEKNAVLIAEDLIDLTVHIPSGGEYRDLLDMNMRFSDDCEQIFYLKGKDLYLLDAMNGGEMILIAENPSRYVFWLENETLFYVKDNTLYSYRNGVTSEIKTNVEKIYKLNPGYLYTKCGDEYFITDGVISYTVTLNTT